MQDPIATSDLGDAQQLAVAQAAKDAELMAALQARKAEVATLVTEDVAEAESKAAAARPRMNRAERRTQVKFYAKLLAETEKQTPIVNPTIRPRSKRRRRKQ